MCIRDSGKGVVRDESERAGAIARAVDDVRALGFEIVAQCDSSLPGPKGNVEAFVRARKQPPP